MGQNISTPLLLEIFRVQNLSPGLECATVVFPLMTHYWIVKKKIEGSRKADEIRSKETVSLLAITEHGFVNTLISNS